MSWRSALIVISAAVAVSVAVVLVVASTFGLPWDESDGSPEALVTPGPGPKPEWEPAGAVLTEGDAAPSAAGMGAALEDPLASEALGGQVGISVIDLANSSTVYDSGADTGQTPASTLKVLTATAALHILGPEHVFTTGVMAEPGGGDAPTRITLVGGGDPTLTTGSSGGASLIDLADRTAKALADDGVSAVELTYDATLFSGPAVDPDWRPSYVPSEVVSPVTALAVDVPDTRPDDPPQAAAEAFAGLLDDRGITVTAEPVAGTADDAATELAVVRSDPVSTIVEDALVISDNDASEVLARHVALGAGHDGTAAAGSTAIGEALTDLGIDMSSSTILDGSGLARDTAVPAGVIASTLAVAADPEHPELRSVLTGLPVAGFTGTLNDRFDDTAGGGLVRAKTGTLTGVSSLAGLVTSADGGRYAFAVLADDISDTLSAEAALDDVAMAIARCGCG